VENLYNSYYSTLIRNTPQGKDPFKSYESRDSFRLLLQMALNPMLCNDWDLSAPESILISGQHGVGKSSLVHGLCAEAEIPVICADLNTFSLFPGNPSAALSQAFSTATSFSPVVLLFDAMEKLFPYNKEEEDETRALASQFVSLMDSAFKDPSSYFLVVGIVTNPSDLHPIVREKFKDEMEIPIPTPKQRYDIFKYYFKKRYHDTTETNVVLEDGICLKTIATDCHGFTGADVKAVCTRMLILASNRAYKEQEESGEGDTNTLVISSHELSCFLEQFPPSALHDITISIPKVHWDDIGGLDEVKEKLQQTITWGYKYAEEFEQLGIKPPRGFLLYGPPGTGKTLLCTAVATEAHANFISQNISELTQSLVGESEKKLREVFKKARMYSPCIIFFDEIDAIFGDRESSGKWTKMMITQLLLELDNIHKSDLSDSKSGEEKFSGVIVIGATNRPDMIDPSFLRPGRFDRSIYVGPPDKVARESILKIHIGSLKCVSDDLNISELVDKTENFTGADLKGVARKAALNALMADHDEITQEDFLAAISGSKPSFTPEMLETYENWGS